VAADPAADPDPEVLVAGRRHDDRALAAGVGHRVDEGLGEQLLLRVGAVQVTPPKEMLTTSTPRSAAVMKEAISVVE